jgi:hypothetical protein
MKYLRNSLKGRKRTRSTRNRAKHANSLHKRFRVLRPVSRASRSLFDRYAAPVHINHCGQER